MYSRYCSEEILITAVWQGAETDSSLHGAPDNLEGSCSTLGHLRVLVVRSGGPPSLACKKEVWICKVTH